MRWGVGLAAAVCLCVVGALPAGAASGAFVPQGTTISPPDEFPASEFGSAVAVSTDGNTALVGGPTDRAGLGAAWVYVHSGPAWTEQAKLVPPVSGTSGAAGTAVALSGDGNTAFVSAPVLNPGGSPEGAVFVYDRSGTSWQSAGEVVPSDEGSHGNFGRALAVSADGSTLAVSGVANGSNAFWVYTQNAGSWQESQLVTAPADQAGASGFGSALTLSTGGTTLLVGGFADNGFKGAAWVYTLANGSWSEAEKIALPSDATQGAAPIEFGTAVALSADGTTALINGPGDNNGAGAAWVFVKSGSTWVEQQKLNDSPATSAFGRFVALTPDGSSAFVTGGTSQGVVVRFTRSGSVWTLADRTGVSDASGQNLFGGPMAAAGSGTTLVIGDVLSQGSGSASDARGQAWVFALNSGTWSEQQTLPPPTDESPWSQFGKTVAVASDGSTAIVGGPTDNNAHGAAWIYVRNGTAWSEQQELVSPTGGGAGLPIESGFAVAISADGETVALGSSGPPGALGAVWIYTRSGASWSLEQQLEIPADASGTSPGFGQALALSADGQTLLVGGPNDRDGTSSGLGAAWVYVLANGTWSEQQKLTVPPEATAATPAFGTAVALSANGSTALIGSHNPGAWVYARSGSSWSEQQEIAAPSDRLDGSGNFGAPVALSADGTTALIGDDLDSSSAGAAWAYALTSGHWSEIEKIAAPADESGQGEFGASLALSSDGTEALIGGPANTSTAGAAWIYRSSGGASWLEQQKLDGTGGSRAADGAAVALAADGSTALVGANRADGEVGGLSVYAIGPATVPGAPTAVSATAGSGQASVSFGAPSSDGGSAITSYTVTASPGGAQATGGSSPIVVSGLTNGVSYTFTVTATNGIGMGPSSAPSSPVTPSTSTGGGGGHGGGGGGSDFIAVSLSPGAQTVPAGGRASWTVTVTNTGGNYVGDVAVSDGSVPGCDQTSGQSAGLYSMAPNVSVSYTCSQSVSSALTNTANASAVGPAGDTIGASASATVTVTGAAYVPPPVAKKPQNTPKLTQSGATIATLSLAPLKVVLLTATKPSLRLSAKLSKRSVLTLVLLDSKGKTLAHWSYNAKAGENTIALLLPRDARKAGHDRLRVIQTGAKKPLTDAITLRS